MSNNLSLKEIHKKYDIKISRKFLDVGKEINYNCWDLKQQGGDMIQWGYDKFYESILQEYRSKEINILEIGILEGLKMFVLSKYLTRANFYGIDIDINNFNNYPHSKDFLDRVIDVQKIDSRNKNETNTYNYNFDLIIDDGDHNPESIILTFKNFYSKLNKGGIYIIEDVRKPSRLNLLKKFFDSKNINFDFMINKEQFSNNGNNFKVKEEGNGIIVIKKK